MLITESRLQLWNTDKILIKRYLNKNGEGQKKLTAIVAKRSNKYVPFLTGKLKDMTVEVHTDFIWYKAPYARKQFYTNKGKGKQGTSFGGLRGKNWINRMWTLEGYDAVKELGEFCLGKGAKVEK